MSKMHSHELAIDLSLAKELIRKQFPEYAGLDIAPVDSIGTVNKIFKLGSDKHIRLPRLPGGKDIEKEWTWLPMLLPQLPLRIPAPVALGKACALYPEQWAIYDWIEGSEYSDESLADEEKAAHDLAVFVNKLHAIDIPPEAPRAGRRPLPELHQVTLDAIDEIKDLAQRDEIISIWKEDCKAAAWDGRPVWIHADLLRSNLLLQDGHLHAILDFGSAGIGDPAFDLIPAWAVFNARGREAYQNAVMADCDTWRRARAYALHQALLIIPYYEKTNPHFVSMAKRTVNEILSDNYQSGGPTCRS